MAGNRKARKLSSRERKKLRIRKKISGTNDRPRVSIFRSTKHTYAQVISDASSKTVVSASTLEKDVQDEMAKLDLEKANSKARSSKSVAAARAVGIVLARRCKEHKIGQVVFDRNGFIYTGRVRAIADGAREGGLEF